MKGRGVHFHRAGHFPAGLWYCAGSVHCVAVPRGQSAIARCVLLLGAADGHVLPLGCRDDVHVR